MLQESIEEKQKRMAIVLSKWNKNGIRNLEGNQLSQAGKVVMINSVMNSIPMHTLLTSWVSSKKISWNGKAIMNGMVALRDGLRISISGGREANLWTDSWIDSIPLNLWPTYIDVRGLEIYKKVSDLIENNAWNEKRLYEFFGKDI
ncbi:ribonuclease H protein [Canna indica]|uniref:Ribonuclease H protein n=1 Tax=Canna indica TaxID=4628 RepID=A0AAQ3JYK2_9LILI|nr:ribonuclease H protein [Canna indica]